MRKLMVVVTHFLLSCALLLALPTITAAQCVSKLKVQRVWTKDAGGNDKTSFAPGEIVQFAVQIDNSYGAYLLAANGTQLTITTRFYNNAKPVDIPPGINTWTWNATTPSGEGNYTITAKAYDHFCGVWVEGSVDFTVGQSSPPAPPSPPHQPTPGWYRNNGPATIHEDKATGLKIVWENSYIYQHPGNDNLYWYAQVKYLNSGTQPLTISCVGRDDPSLTKEHIRATEGIPPNGDGYIPADETFCKRNPNFTDSIKPGEAHDEWAIFHNVPPSGEIALEWGPYPFSPSWVDPWHFPYPTDAPSPIVCPTELVTLGTCKKEEATPPPPVPEPVPTPTPPPPPLAYGEKFREKRDEKGLHHYVFFHINPPRFGRWRVEGLAVPSWFPFGGTDPDPWPQTSPDNITAGFHWPDPPFPSPDCCLKPSYYRLYSK